MGVAVVEDVGWVITTGRAAALAAFRPVAAMGQSPIAYFAGQKPSKKGGESKKRQPSTCNSKQKSEKEDNAADRAEAKLRRELRQNEVHCSASRPAGFSKPPLIDLQRLHGAIRRSIGELPGLQRLWVHATCRPAGRTREEYRQEFARTYVGVYSEAHLGNCRPGTRRMVRYLIDCAILNASNTHLSIQPDGHDINRETWKKRYLPHWRQICDDIDQVDREAFHRLGNGLSN
ncbi:MAG: hypothetical protein Hals2KO_21410 [Halioglobus sp.]